MKKILNLTQHVATPEQTEAGVIEPADKSVVQQLLTFSELPTSSEVVIRAERLALIAKFSDVEACLIGGAPYLMAPLETLLKKEGITPLYAYSKRVSEEKTQEDGSVKKINIFKHVGFVKGGV